MGSESKPERRKAPRYEVSINVDHDSLYMFTGNYVSNLSKGGFFIETNDPLPVQSDIDLTLFIGELGKKIKVQGKVAWNYDRTKDGGKMKTGMGIKFTDLSPENKTILTEYLEEVGKKQEPLPED